MMQTVDGCLICVTSRVCLRVVNHNLVKIIFVSESFATFLLNKMTNISLFASTARMDQNK